MLQSRPKNTAILPIQYTLVAIAPAVDFLVVPWALSLFTRIHRDPIMPPARWRAAVDYLLHHTEFLRGRVIFFGRLTV